MRKEIVFSLISASIAFPISAAFSVSLPFIPIESVKNTAMITTTLVSSTAGLIGLKYLFNFKNFHKKIELPINKGFSFLSKFPIFYQLKLYNNLYLKLKKVNWKVIGNKIINYFDYADIAVGSIPIFGDIFDVVDLSMHIVYDYKFEKGNLKWDLIFVGMALIPGVSAGMERVSYRLFTRKLIKVGLDAKKAKKILEISKEFKWGRKTKINVVNFFKLNKARKLADKDIRFATETAYGYSFLLREERKVKKIEVIKFVDKNFDELKKFEGKGLHRVVFQYGFLGKKFSISKVNKLYKMFGKEVKGVLLFDLRDVDYIIKDEEIRKVVKDLNDVAFERFTYINIEREVLGESQRIVKIIKSIKATSVWIEKAERMFKVDADYSHINMIKQSGNRWAGEYSERGFLSFNFAYYEDEKYLVKHEMMHAIGSKVIKHEERDKIWEKFYSEYSKVHSFEVAKYLSDIATNEYMDLVNIKLWNAIGHKKYLYEHLRSMKMFKGLEIKNNKIIIDEFEEENLIFANEYKSLVKNLKIEFAKDIDSYKLEYLKDVSNKLNYVYTHIKVRK